MGLSSDSGTEPVLGEGHYTVVLAGAGHRTLEATRAGPDFRAGPFIVSYLCGPDNERDYRAFAHITAAGDGRLWPRFRDDSTLAAALAALVADPTGAAGTTGEACAACGAGDGSPIPIPSSEAWGRTAPALR